MIKEKILSVIHEVGQGRYCDPVLGWSVPYITTSDVMFICDCSRSYAIKWLNFYSDSGYLSRIRTPYKNVVKDLFCAPHDLEKAIVYVSGFKQGEILETQHNGEWETCQ